MSLKRLLMTLALLVVQALTRPLEHTVRVQPMPATAGYPAIEEEAEQAIENAPDLAASTLHPQQNGLDGAVFPYARDFGCEDGLLPDFVVPVCNSPTLGSFVSLLGMPGAL